MTRILLADDHGVVRQGLRAVLARDALFEVIGESGDGREAVRLAEALQPDVVIMDISMPQLNGIQAAKQILKANPRTHIIILSMHSDETYLMRALQAGVKGYLLKESAEEDLIRAVRMVAQGKPFFSPAVDKRTAGRLHARHAAAKSAGLLRPADRTRKGSAAVTGRRKIEQGSRYCLGPEHQYSGNTSHKFDAETRLA